MPFDGSGNYTRVHDWTQDRDNNITIQAERMDQEFDDMAAAFNAVFFRNGLVAMAADLDMGGFAIKSLDSGIAAAPALRFQADVDSGILHTGSAVGIAYGGVTRVTVNADGLFVGANKVLDAGTLDPTKVAKLDTAAAFTANVSTTGTLTANGDVSSVSGAIRKDAGFYMAMAGVTPVLNFDPSDFISYDRVNNGFGFAIGGVTDASITGGFVNARLGMTVAGNSVFHAGNFNPATKADVAGQQFSGDISIVKSSGNSQLVLQRTGQGTVNFAMQGDGNFIMYRDGAPVFNQSGSTSPVDFAVRVRAEGRAVPTTSRGSGRSVTIEDGTAAPSGGGDGDIYFQYS